MIYLILCKDIDISLTEPEQSLKKTQWLSYVELRVIKATIFNVCKLINYDIRVHSLVERQVKS